MSFPSIVHAGARSVVALAIAAGFSMSAWAGDDDNEKSSCAGLPNHAQLKGALTGARNASNGGFNLDMWGTVVNRDGVVCAVAFTGANRSSQWPGSRVISAQKAYTANAFSLPGLALATANLYSAVQPGGSLFGLQESNPVDSERAYKGPAQNWGAPNDPMTGKRVGGINVFGGGLALYNSAKQLVGAIGVSGDSSCADHAIAWRARSTLFMDYVPAGVVGGKDRLAYPGEGPFAPDSDPWSQPHCVNAATENAVLAGLPATR